MFLSLIFAITFFLSFIFTLVAKKLATKFNILDKPGENRKIHKKAIPLLGGFGVFLAFFIVLFIFQERVLVGSLSTKHWLGFFIGACFLMIGGFMDDKFNLKPKEQIVWAILAIISVIASGIGIEKITNPLGGLLFLNNWQLPIIKIGENWTYFVIISDLFTFIWLLSMMYTTKLLDGIDGLVSGVTMIGSLIIFLFTMSTKYYQPDIGFASLILAGACLGFLVLNWHPAKIFLGEGGSLFLGFSLGVLAIISGGKIAIALLVMGLPILDVIWTILRRLKQGKNPFKFSDKKHLHHRLLNLGIGQRKTVLIYYFFALSFGLSGLFLQSAGKLLALSLIALIMIILISLFAVLEKKYE